MKTSPAKAITLLVLSLLIATTGTASSALFHADASGDFAASIYLPLVLRDFPRTEVYGAEISNSNISDETISKLADDGGIYWLRYTAFRWDLIEPVKTTPRTYNLAGIDESGLKLAADEGLNIIASIRFSPSWARSAPSLCSQINESNLNDFAEFLGYVVKTYSAPPYNIHYWELGNEPDVDPSEVPTDSIFGCWGDKDDPYYGGSYYAKMLKAAYPAIKAADPQAKVLIGGLLLDCDPTAPANCTTNNRAKAGKFFEGILMGGGGPYFDIVSFHGYTYYNTQNKGNPVALEAQFPSWAARGGGVMGKVNFLREVMAKYGITRPIFLTEGALLCSNNDASCANSDYLQAQADYLVWLYVRNWAEGLSGTIWYTFDAPGWRYSSLLDGNQMPKPAYNALKALTQELKGAKYQKKITQYSGLQGFEFALSDKRVWMLASVDNNAHTISLPAGYVSAHDKYGALITPSNNQLSVLSPIYVELTP